MRLRGLDRGERVALVISECQVAIVDPVLAMVPGLAQQVAARGVLARIAALADVCRANAAPVIHCTVHLPINGAAFPTNSPLHAMIGRNPLLQAGRAEGRVHPEIRMAASDIVSDRRHGVTGFYNTDLDALLRKLAVETVILAGVSTNIALPGMAIEAINRGYAVVLPEDCTAGGSRDTHEHAVRHVLPILATVTDSASVIAILGSRMRI